MTKQFYNFFSTILCIRKVVPNKTKNQYLKQ